MRAQRVVITAGEISPAEGLLCIGGHHGKMMLLDIRSKTLVQTNYETHREPVLAIHFVDKQNCIISIGKNCQICLWSMYSLELLQEFRDYKFSPDYFNCTHVDIRRLTLYCATMTMRTYLLRRNNEAATKYQQAEQLIAKSKTQMNAELLKIAQSSDAAESKAISKEIKRELNLQRDEMYGTLQTTVLSNWKNLKRNVNIHIGSVLMSDRTKLMHFDTNYLHHAKDNRNRLRLFTIDADWLMRIWYLNCEDEAPFALRPSSKATEMRSQSSDEANAQNKIGGACTDSVLLKRCPRDQKLMSKRDRLSTLQHGAEARKIGCAVIDAYCEHQFEEADSGLLQKYMVAFAD